MKDGNKMIGQTISHYKVLEKIGKGGMGVVYKAEDTKLDRLVALKFLPPHLNIHEDEKKRFIHEAKAAAALNHPNIVTIYEINEYEGQTYIAMEYLEGETLKDKISRRPLPLSEAINISMQIAQGLSRAHESTIIHRDIKPANIIISKRDEVKILDFGLAKLRGVTKLTKEGTTLGTVAYMSPEQAAGEEIGHRSDIWSLGVVLYEMVTGQSPFKGEYEQAIMYAIMNDDPEPVTGLRTGVSMDLERIIQKTFKKDPKERYQHAGDLLVDLKNLQKEPSAKKIEQSKGITEPIKPPSKKRWIPVTVGIMMVLVVAGYFILKKTPQPGKQQIHKTASKESTFVDSKWKNSIAVLPFTNISADKEQDYFCDGMTEDIITKLSYIKNLKVISRTSVMQYKNTTKTIREIGKELAVKNILEGSVRKEKDRIRITAQLIQVDNDAHLWAKNYDRKLESVFEVQDEVSKTIAEALKVTLSPETLQSFQTSRPENLQAYEYYLKGMHIFNTRFFIRMKTEDFESARNMLLKALEIDPKLIKAYNGLVYFHALHLLLTRDTQNVKTMKTYADRAIKLDPNSAVGYGALGLTKIFMLNFADAYTLFKKALAINPNDPIINYEMVAFYIPQNLYKKAFEYCIRAMEVDPLFLPSYITAARCQLYLGNYKECEYYLKQGFETHPQQPLLFGIAAHLSMCLKRYDQAGEWLKKLETARSDSEDVTGFKALLSALKGNKEKALAIPETNRSDEIYAVLGMKDKAIGYLEKLLRDNPLHYDYLYLTHSPFYDNLRDHRRFQEIVALAKDIYEERLQKYGDL